MTKPERYGNIEQQSPKFLASGTGFVEDKVPTDWAGDGPGGNTSDVECWGAADEASLLPHPSPPATWPSS